MLNFLDIADMNHRQQLKRRHESARRALLYLAYCAAAITAGLMLGQLLATL
jgi:hypothetical protein